MSESFATCPFCSLLCDDLVVTPGPAGLVVAGGACERACVEFSALGAASPSPRVRGRAAGLDEALDEAARLLGAARRPAIGGLDVDVSAMRAILPLAQRLGAVIDHSGSFAKYRNLHVVQESGLITTTFAEVRNRADVVVLVGDGWQKRFPRFVERMLAPAPVFSGSDGRRRFILLNPADRSALPAETECLELAVPMSEMPALAGTLAALAAGRPVSLDRAVTALGGSPSDGLAERLARCVDWLREARYGALIWSAADLEFPHAELAVQAMARLLRVLNEKTRFAGLPLAGVDGDLTANAVQTWRSGLPLPASYANGTVDFDPHRHALPGRLARGECDVLLWVSSLGKKPVPVAEGVPTIVLGRADRTFDTAPDVYIPFATPGVDAPGHLLRGDKVITLFLKPVRSGSLPTAAATIEALAARLEPATC
jgi:formylmethanofuran dehydrogenase subunit B